MGWLWNSLAFRSATTLREMWVHSQACNLEWFQHFCVTRWSHSRLRPFRGLKGMTKDTVETSLSCRTTDADSNGCPPACAPASLCHLLLCLRLRVRPLRTVTTTSTHLLHPPPSFILTSLHDNMEEAERAAHSGPSAHYQHQSSVSVKGFHQDSQGDSQRRKCLQDIFKVFTVQNSHKLGRKRQHN